MIVRDRLQAHRGHLVREYLLTHDHARTVFRPPYAPELHPIEYLWGYLKMNPFANDLILELEELAAKARCHSRSIQRQPELLRSFIEHSPLSLRLK